MEAVSAALAPAVSVIVRCRNEADDIGEVLDLVLAQDLDGREVEVVVVDSGSTDGTLDVVRARPVKLIEIPSAEFTYGRALNVGCAAATAPIMVALSAHAYPLDDRWLARVLEVFEDEKVACAYGVDNAPEGGLLTERVVQDLEHSERFPFWGYGNPAGAFRAELWRQRHWREDMPSTEDKEWADYWMRRGHVVVIDPTLRTRHDHSEHPLRLNYRRSWASWRGHTMYQDVPRYGLGDLLHEWWFGKQGWPTHFRARLSPQRIARLLGKYTGLAPTRKKDA